MMSTAPLTDPAGRTWVQPPLVPLVCAGCLDPIAIDVNLGQLLLVGDDKVAHVWCEPEAIRNHPAASIVPIFTGGLT